jgi:hypothetical protein
VPGRSRKTQSSWAIPWTPKRGARVLWISCTSPSPRCLLHYPS